MQIERMDALRLIGRYDDPDVLMYIDPPYLRSTRKSGRLYRHEMDCEEHKRLLGIITNSRAKIVLSGYPSEMYDSALQGWYRDTVMSQTTSTEMAEEVIWMNYEPPYRQLEFAELETGRCEG